MEMKLSANKKSAQLSISGTFTAAELERFIGELLVLRARLAPPVPYDVPTPESDDDSNAVIEEDPTFGLGIRRDGRLRLLIRSAGLGWLVFHIPRAKAAAMRDYLAANATGKPDLDFVAKKSPNGNASH